MAHDTHLDTLYQLTGVVPTPEGMLDVLDAARLDALCAEFQVPPLLDVPSLLISFRVDRDEAAWCKPSRRRTGCEVSESERSTGQILMLAVDGEVYAVCSGQGYRLIPEHLKVKRFGLAVTIRKVNPEQLRDLYSHAFGTGRTDIALAPGGTPVLGLGIEEHARIVHRLGGFLEDMNLTKARAGRGGRLTADGGNGLRLHLGVEPHDLVADVREIGRVAREVSPHPDLAFVEHVAPVDKALGSRLDAELDRLIGAGCYDRIYAAIPADLHDAWSNARTCQMNINHRRDGRTAEDFDLDYVLDQARVHRPGDRVKVLRNGTVSLYKFARVDERDLLDSGPAYRWIEAGVSLGSRQYCLQDGQWYEIGAQFLAGIRRDVARCFPATSSIWLPRWTRGFSEDAYNREAAELDGRVCLDQRFVPNPLHPGNKLEICDVLAEDDTLIMVKKAHRSGPLSHLFKQGSVAVQALQYSDTVRRDFADAVRDRSGGKRLVPANFTPKRVMFAIFLKDGADLTPDSLFPFSQIALAQTVRTLASWGVAVEVVGIQSAPAISDADRDRRDFRPAA